VTFRLHFAQSSFEKSSKSQSDQSLALSDHNHLLPPLLIGLRKMINIEPKDVLLGRGPICYQNPGNVMFRKLINEHYKTYNLTTPRLMKKYIVKALIDKIHGMGIRFLVRSANERSWHLAHPHLVQAKVSHALRDARIVNIDRVALKKLKVPACVKEMRPKVFSNMSKVYTPNNENQQSVQDQKNKPEFSNLLEVKPSIEVFVGEIKKKESPITIKADDNKRPTQVHETTNNYCDARSR
jgi:hypothetical protein